MNKIEKTIRNLRRPSERNAATILWLDKTKATILKIVKQTDRMQENRN